MNKTNYIRVAACIIGIFLIVIMCALVIKGAAAKETKHQQELKAKELSTQHLIDSLESDRREEIAALQVETMRVMDERDSLINVINSQIHNIKIDYGKKVDNVALLPADSLLRLLSEDLSSQ